MSEGNGKIATMDKVKVRAQAKVLAEYFLPIFEQFWIDDTELDKKDVVFALYQNNLSFQIAFAVEYNLIDITGLSDISKQDIQDTYDILTSGSYLT